MDADWVMVAITAVYVIATCFICFFNHQSAKASREQLAEMRKQYQEENRPNIQVEFVFERRTWYIVRFVNHGKKTAQNVQIMLRQEFIDSLPKDSIRMLLRKQNDKKCLIGVGQHYDLYIGGNELRGNPNMRPVSGVVSYSAEGKDYRSEFYVDLENYMTFFSSTNEQDELMKVIKDGTRELKSISSSIRNLSGNNENT